MIPYNHHCRVGVHQRDTLTEGFGLGLPVKDEADQYWDHIGIAMERKSKPIYNNRDHIRIIRVAKRMVWFGMRVFWFQVCLNSVKGIPKTPVSPRRSTP